MLYSAAFNLAQQSGLGTITLTLQSGAHSPVTVTLGSLGYNNSTVMWHFDTGFTYAIIAEDPSGAQRRTDIAAAPFGMVVQTALRSFAGLNSWTNPNNINVTFSLTTGLYTIAYADAAFSISWSTSAGRQFCGFAADTGNATTQTGTVVPPYVIVPTLSATSIDQSMQGLNYEPDGIATDVTADNGAGYSMSRGVAPLYRDFRQELELKAKVFRRNAASTHPWTFEALKQQCRQGYPFLVYNGFGSVETEVFSLRGAGMSWKPDRRSLMDTLFDVNFMTRVEGLLTPVV